MDPRYFVTRKVVLGGDVSEVTCGIGRHRDMESAYERAGQLDGEILLIRPETRIEALAYPAGRLLMRAMRIAAAVVLGYVAYQWLAPDSQLGDVPLAQLTLKDLFDLAFFAVVAIGGYFVCTTIAFGPGPEDSPFS